MDPCVLYKQTKRGNLLIGLYVDDLLCIGDKQDLENFVEDIKRMNLSVTVDKDLKEYLGCDVIFNQDRTGLILKQSHIIKGLLKKFNDLTRGKKTYDCPGTPHKNIIRGSEDDKYIDTERQKVYRSGVGILLYLVKHTRLDIANATRELSKCLDKATEETWKELLRAIKYVIDTQDRGLIMNPTIDGNEWIVEAYSDSDYAGDADTRMSVGGYVLLVNKVPVSWRSKAQKTITLSSTEAEYIALSEAAKEVKYIVQFLQSMGIKVRLPVIIHVDNIGAIFMAENVNTSQRTKHVDVRYKFVRNYIMDGFIKIEYVKTDKNLADIMTKNVTAELHKKHVTGLLTN